MKNPIRKLLYLWMAGVLFLMVLLRMEPVVYIRLIDVLPALEFIGASITLCIAFLAGRESKP